MAQTAEPIVRTEVVTNGPTFAAKIRDGGFTRLRSDATTGTIHRALSDYKMLFFRDAAMMPAQHIAFGKQFGELTVDPFAPHLDEVPGVLTLENHKDDPAFSTDVSHTDETFRLDPPISSLLRCLRAPERDGDTLRADMAAFYTGLSTSGEPIAAHALDRLTAMSPSTPTSSLT